MLGTDMKVAVTPRQGLKDYEKLDAYEAWLNCDFNFLGRYSGEDDYFSGNGKLFKRRVWESNFIANALDMLLYGCNASGHSSGLQ